jgi:hypothetical protein
LLAERGQELDSAVLGEPVGDPASRRAEGEPQFEQTVAEASRQRHSQRRPERRQPVDDHHHPIPLGIVERVHPLDDLIVQLGARHRESIALLR